MLASILPIRRKLSFLESPTGNVGFTLLELVSVVVVIGILASTAVSSLVPSTTFQLQAGRDTVVAALFHAQQRALSQTDSIRVVTSGGSIDIRQDSNNNSSFESNESIHVGGLKYPLILDGGVTISGHTLNYDRLGETASTTLTLTKSSSSETITVSATGFAY